MWDWLTGKSVVGTSKNMTTPRYTSRNHVGLVTELLNLYKQDRSRFDVQYGSVLKHDGIICNNKLAGYYYLFGVTILDKPHGVKIEISAYVSGDDTSPWTQEDEGVSVCNFTIDGVIVDSEGVRVLRDYIVKQKERYLNIVRWKLITKPNRRLYKTDNI